MPAPLGLVRQGGRRGGRGEQRGGRQDPGDEREGERALGLAGGAARG